MRAASRPSGWARSAASTASAPASGTNATSLPSLATQQRIEAERSRRRRAPSSRTGTAARRPRCRALPRRDLDQRRRQPAARRIAHGVHAAARRRAAPPPARAAAPCRWPARRRARAPRAAPGSRRRDRRWCRRARSRRPGARAATTSSTPAGTTPMPEVLMKILSPLPRPTTLVSPVTTGTPARAAAACTDSITRRRSASGSPSSRMNASDSASGRAPPTARSLMVPFTASSPMSPPRKEDRRHHVGVGGERQARAVALDDTPGRRAAPAPDCETPAGSAPRSAARSAPPLPWPSSTWSAVDERQRAGGERQPIAASEDIVFSQRDVQLIPQQVQQRSCASPDAMDRPGRHHEARARTARPAPAVASGEADRSAGRAARARFDGAVHVGRRCPRSRCRARRRRAARCSSS